MGRFDLGCYAARRAVHNHAIPPQGLQEVEAQNVFGLSVLFVRSFGKRVIAIMCSFSVH